MRYRLSLIVLFLLIFLIGGFFVYLIEIGDLFSTGSCFNQYESSMTPAEISKVFDVPLVALSRPPSDVSPDQIVAPYEVFSGEIPICGIAITYNSITTASAAIYITVLPRRGNSQISEDIWNCSPVSIASLDFETQCAITTSASDKTIAVNLFTQYAQEATQSLTEDITFIWPN
jgi:hypothetical protein